MHFRFENAPHDNVKYGNQKYSQGRGGKHPARDARADGVSAGGTCSGADHQRHDAQNESERRHENWPQPQVHGFKRRLNQSSARQLKILRVFNDQNGVLGCQAYGGQEANFEINIVRQAAQHGGEERS